MTAAFLDPKQSENVILNYYIVNYLLINSGQILYLSAGNEFTVSLCFPDGSDLLAHKTTQLLGCHTQLPVSHICSRHGRIVSDM